MYYISGRCARQAKLPDDAAAVKLEVFRLVHHTQFWFLLVLLVPCAIEVIQIHLPGRVAEITDPLVALILVSRDRNREGSGKHGRVMSQSTSQIQLWAESSPDGMSYQYAGDERPRSSARNPANLTQNKDSVPDGARHTRNAAWHSFYGRMDSYPNPLLALN